MIDWPRVEQPAPQPGPLRAPDDAPVPHLDPHERVRIRAAVLHAMRLYPGPVGELIGRELSAWQDFGHRFADDGLVRRLINHVMTTPLP